MQPERISRTLRASAFSPIWLPAPWNKPLVGYAFAVFLPSVMILFTWFVLQHLPTFAQSSTLIVTLLWGTGPGLVATELDNMGHPFVKFIIFYERMLPVDSTGKKSFFGRFFSSLVKPH